MRRVIGIVCWGVAVACGLLLIGMAVPRPIAIDTDLAGARVTFAADRQWVLFPRQCVDVTWSATGVAGVIFYPKSAPGLGTGEGVRSVLNSRIYRPGLTTAEDALGGITTLADETGSVAGAGQGCPDFGVEPKLRVLLPDGSSQALKLRLDVLFLRLEAWGLIFGVIGAVFAGAWLLRHPMNSPFERIFLGSSTAVLAIYGVLFVSTPAFLTAYVLDCLIFFGVFLACAALTLEGIVRPAAFDRRMASWLTRPTRVWVGVLLGWGWLLAFAYYDPQRSWVGESIWLPLLVWAAVVGTFALWRATPQPTSPAPLLRSRRVSLVIALAVFGVLLLRDLWFLEIYSPIVLNDTPTYVVEARDFTEAGKTTGLPKRIFPYLFLNFITQSWYSPIGLVLLQIVVGALSGGLLVYVLSRMRLALGIGVGVLLATHFLWGFYNISVMTEGLFVSFHVMCFAVILWHIQRRDTVRGWELFVFGLLCAWTFLFRGTGLPLIVPVLLIYGLTFRRLVNPALVLAGFLVFLLTVGLYNQWRYAEFGLVGAQNDTLASALFSYHLFSPENGATSALIDDKLRGCMGYLDYDDVPRSSIFIYQQFNRCLLGHFEREELTRQINRALFELIRSRPFDFARVVTREVGVGVSALGGQEFFSLSRIALSGALLRCEGLYVVCPKTPTFDDRRVLDVLYATNQLSMVSTQIYTASDLISSPTDIVRFGAFLMMFGALWAVSRQKLLVLMSVGFIVYQLLTVSIAHTFLLRYGVVNMPFLAVLSVMTLVVAFGGARRLLTHRLSRLGLVVLVVVGLYIAFAQPWVRGQVTAPLLASTSLNFFQKYGLTDDDWQQYRALRAQGITTLYPTSNELERHPLSALQAVVMPNQLARQQVSPFIAWRYSRLPGYLRDADLQYVLMDAAQWSALTDGERAILLDPRHYRLVESWEHSAGTQRLFEVVGDARTTQVIYERNGIVIFLQPDASLHVYRLDEEQNGIFMAQIDPTTLLNFDIDSTTADGWRVKSVVRSNTVLVYDPAGNVVDDGFGIVWP